MKEQDYQFRKRLQDLSRTAYYREIPVFTDFLDLNELHMVHSFRPEEDGIHIRYFGGYEEAERQIAAFLPDALSYEGDWEETVDFPIDCLKIVPLSGKFSETLSHRDYLGALVNLGIERSKLGDILVKEKEAYLFCQEKMTDFLCENLTRVRHTPVHLLSVADPQELPRPEFRQIRGTVASVRLDSMIGLAFSTSRSSMTGLIEGGKVFVNGRMVVSNGHPLKPGDVVSVRGYGKFRYEETVSATKKGRYCVCVSRYV